MERREVEEERGEKEDKIREERTGEGKKKRKEEEKR